MIERLAFEDYFKYRKDKRSLSKDELQFHKEMSLYECILLGDSTVSFSNGREYATVERNLDQKDERQYDYILKRALVKSYRKSNFLRTKTDGQ